ncbi:hypothetical protein C440_05597 [Haloferax mucosum ATCC BAA-1512]|uniref:HTH marR-type domain-containing protein n=1 Tax=Haloferax mucosum ATCC BAA-1512 TaxID=662479 RepID=M0IKS6_9EURY|nr:helix-turn-helix domain-containing protein [Haloferax mucosum]ELZ96039.1 hypothetical protein C440_05597 [Haloferax mucosum ATCC BAA-1512]
MPTITRQERTERIARDDGDEDDTVWIAQSYQHQGAYHTDRDCSCLQATTPTDTTRGRAQQRLRYPCGRCVLDESEEGASNVSVRAPDTLGIPEELDDAEAATKLVYLELVINGPLSTIELIDLTSLSRSSISRGIDTLDERGLVETEFDPRDARRKRHFPTT